MNNKVDTLRNKCCTKWQYVCLPVTWYLTITALNFVGKIFVVLQKGNL